MRHAHVQVAALEARLAAAEAKADAVRVAAEAKEAKTAAEKAHAAQVAAEAEARSSSRSSQAISRCQTDRQTHTQAGRQAGVFGHVQVLRLCAIVRVRVCGASRTPKHTHAHKHKHTHANMNSMRRALPVTPHTAQHPLLRLQASPLTRCVCVCVWWWWWWCGVTPCELANSTTHATWHRGSTFDFTRARRGWVVEQTCPDTHQWCSQWRRSTNCALQAVVREVHTHARHECANV